MESLICYLQDFIRCLAGEDSTLRVILYLMLFMGGVNLAIFKWFSKGTFWELVSLFSASMSFFTAILLLLALLQ